MSRTGSAAKALLVRVCDRWLEVFFADGSSFDLAVSRLLFFGGLSLLYLGTDFRPWANVSPVFWMPISLFKILGIGVAPFPVLGVLQLLWKVCLVFLCLGFLTRASAAVAAVLGFYLLGLQNSMGKTDHFDAIVVFVCLIFAVANQRLSGPSMAGCGNASESKPSCQHRQSTLGRCGRCGCYWH